MQSSQELFKKIIETDKNRRVLSSVQNLLSWDQETYLPEAATEFRAEQVELLASMAHEKLTSKTFEHALGHLIDIKTGSIQKEDLTDEQKAALREWRRDFLRASTLPNSFVKEHASLTSKAFTAWVSAKKENDFSIFAPFLQSIVDASKKRAEYYGYKNHPYDALVDEYEPGMTTEKLKKVFSELKPFLIDLVKKCGSAENEFPFLHKTFPKDGQMDICATLMERMGIDPRRSRLDHAHHPFCMPVHPNDLRLTTHSDLSNFFNNIGATLHEGGHGLYELGLPVEKFGTPLCEAVSLGVHESQSRFWECFIGLSRPFITYLHSLLSTPFKEQLEGVTVDEMYSGLTQVTPSFIRIKSDEVTYCLHVILRFELEVALVEGTINVDDVPDAWNEKMQEYLGIYPSNFSEGCLQDVHWSHGIFGYFPTYALGNIYAGALFESFAQAHPDWKLKVEKGEMQFIRDYLTEKVHKFGRQYLPEELLKQATGQGLSLKPYKKYLQKKFS